MRRFLFLPVLACAAVLSSCLPEEDVTPVRFTYTIRDSHHTLPVGVPLAVVHGEAGECPSSGSSLRRTQSVVILDPSGPVVLSFKLSYPKAFVEGFYLDQDASGNLNFLDRVLGPSTTGDISTLCYASMDEIPTQRNLDWSGDLFPAYYDEDPIWIGGSKKY